MKQIRILLVDDHEILMDGIAALLEDIPELKVAGKSSNVQDAIENIILVSPDIVITDITMGSAGGLELTREVSSRFPQIPVMVLSMHDTPDHIRSLMQAGARGYLLKNVRKAELVKAIHSVMSGEEYIQLELVPKYIQEPAIEKNFHQILSPREIEIIRLISKDLTTTEISKALFLSQFTVETHRKNILRKTNTKTVVGLLNYAREHQLL